MSDLSDEMEAWLQANRASVNLIGRDKVKVKVGIVSFTSDSAERAARGCRAAVESIKPRLVGVGDNTGGGI